VGTRGIYLSNYIRWDPKKQNELMIKKYNYKTKFFNRTFDKYEYVDCFNYMGIHDILKQYKHGYSKVTDQASREIRFGRLKRKDAEIIVNYFQSQKIEYEDNFCEWIGIKKQSLYLILNSFKKNFSYSNFKDHNKKYVIKDNKVLKKINDQFKLTKNLNISDNDYITFGKGHKNLT
jgi:hypothetical protein